MQLKLDKLITKNVNGIAIQIYATLIVYLILQLIEIPPQWGQKLLCSCVRQYLNSILYTKGIIQIWNWHSCNRQHQHTFDYPKLDYERLIHFISK